LATGKIPYRFLVTFGLLVILTQCSVEKNTSTTRFYHGLTSRFNIYFNGYESYKAGLARISNGYTDDYADILRVFEYSDPSTVSMCSSNMETAIQKASKLISLKSITARPDFKSKRDLSESDKKLLEQKEFNEWVDDSYLLIGKARFHKHEFNEAASVFTYCITEANDPLIRTEATIWLARINNEQGNYSESGRIVNSIMPEPESPKSLKAMYYTTLADLYVKQKRYTEAIEPLSESLKYLSGKRPKYRLTYLLAQLHEQSGDASKAIALYKEVLKMNPPYEVEFNARINIAGVFDINSGNPSQIRNELEKMLKDSKNKDYQDQIYYALGNLNMKEGKEKEAVELYMKSTAPLFTNQNQKGRSYLALADYFFAKPEYLKAGKYYDSTVYFLDQKHPDYNALKEKSQNLNALVEQLVIIQTEDSLQKVALMKKPERDALIAGIINKIIKEENEGRTSQYADRYNMGQYYENERRFRDNIAQEGKWYFYNQSALTFGRSEFRKRWGDRKLEDNWRRMNKARISIQLVADNGDAATNEADSVSPVADYKKPEFYLKNLPLNDSLMAASNEKMAFAFLNAGKAYSERLKDVEGAAGAFEQMISRFPDNILVPEALYNLHKVYKPVNNQKAETYRQRLLERYPESEYALILSDPEYYNKQIARTKMAEQTYATAYEAFEREDFAQAISICEAAAKSYPDSELAPKFHLLKAYSLARTSDERTLKQELANLIGKWPETAESKRASEMIEYLNQKLPELKTEEDIEIAAELFIADTTALHIFVLIITEPGFNINQASFDVISYNIDNYTNQNYRTEGSLFDNKYIMIKVSGFPRNSNAWNYYREFDAGKIIRNSSGIRMMSFLINENNLKALEKDRNPERYHLFFRENYLQEKVMK
jgi:tetratricopeptide (TPR) repeat protein